MFIGFSGINVVSKDELDNAGQILPYLITNHLTESGLLYGIVFVSHQIGSFLGAYLGGVFYEMHGNFDYAWYVSIALSIFAGLIHLPIKEKSIERVQTA